jgi:hypothetical protein
MMPNKARETISQPKLREERCSPEELQVDPSAEGQLAWRREERCSPEELQVDPSAEGQLAWRREVVSAGKFTKGNFKSDRMRGRPPGRKEPSLIQERLRIFETRLAEIFEHMDFPEELRSALASSFLTQIVEALAQIVEAEGRPAGITTRLSDPASMPVSALPEKAPEEWADRPARENPVAFIERVYAHWLGKGLTRAHLRELDRSLYQALAKWLERHPVPESFNQLLESPSDRVDKKLAELAITNPTDAYARVDDRREAARLYQAALWRQRRAKAPRKKGTSAKLKAREESMPSR